MVIHMSKSYYMFSLWIMLEFDALEFLVTFFLNPPEISTPIQICEQKIDKQLHLAVPELISCVAFSSALSSSQ